MGNHLTIIREPLGRRIERAFVSVPFSGATALRDTRSGRLFPVQTLPSLPLDAVQEPVISAILVDLEPHEQLQLVPVQAPAVIPDRFQIVRTTDVEIHNGARAVRLPVSGWYEPPFPGPILGVRCPDGTWTGSSRLVGIDGIADVRTRIEALGPCCVQWRTSYRWGSNGGLDVRCRWLPGSDTIQVVEDVREDGDAWIQWHPLGTAPAHAFVGGGGEGLGPMQALRRPSLEAASDGSGARLLGHLAHIGYSNQWNHAWVGFHAGEAPFLGIFTGWGGKWQRRGRVRPAVWLDEEERAHLRLPVRRGRRLYGLLISTADASGMHGTDRRCLLNRRKAALADLALDKTRHWLLAAAPKSTQLQLCDPADRASFRARIRSDTQVAEALDRYSQQLEPSHPAFFASALWANDRDRMHGHIRTLDRWAQQTLADVADGGYERLIIFDGRSAKRLAYDFDVLWAGGLMPEGVCRRIGSALLALAYMFADADFCRYGDFWPDAEPESGMTEALRDEIGDCPVPPNFASEYFTTTGCVAELFSLHPQAERWRAWATETARRFISRFVATDGTYAESLNYHTHMFNELLCHLYPLALHGGHDFFGDSLVRRSFEHFIHMQMPPLQRSHVAEAHTALTADAQSPLCAPLPADGNSGGEGLEMPHRGELALGARIYRQSDPRLSARLMTAWRSACSPVLDNEHPVLTLLTLDPGLPADPAPLRSVSRLGQGVISRAHRTDGTPIWCLFRAGSHTHHMDFDQGNLHLAFGDRVLLGDYGYHAHDTDGISLTACETWLHNTVTYGPDRHLTSGYTGLEEAPEPLRTRLGPAYDWCVLRIVNDNYRKLDELPYHRQIPAPETVHVRHYLFVKPHYIVLWDVLERAQQPATLWLHPGARVVQIAPGHFRAGQRGTPHLDILIAQPARFDIIENRQVGPLWSFAVRAREVSEHVTVLMPGVDGNETTVDRQPGPRTLRITRDGVTDVIEMPPPGSFGDPSIRLGTDSEPFIPPSIAGLP